MPSEVPSRDRPSGRPHGGTARFVHVELPCTLDSVAAARRALDALAGRIPSRRLQDIRLLVSELVTNALRHANLGAQDTVALRVDMEGDVLRTCVCDSGRGFRPGAPPTDPARASGWGLYLVESIAERWGVEPAGADSGSCVWFELRLADELTASSPAA